MVLSCYHPLKGWYTGEYHPSGKPKLLISSYACQVPPMDLSKLSSLPHFIEIPCGQCIGCRLERSRQWANRCMLELQDHPEDPGYFVTFSYDQDHLPWSWYSDESTGEAIPAMTLFKKDFQDMFKRLRKNTGQKIRYFGCGEYGPKRMRPHGHFSIFGLRLDDVRPLSEKRLPDGRPIVSKSPQGFPYFYSPLLDSIWSFPRRDEYMNDMESDSSNAGLVVVAPITWETCAYTARYITKKLTGDQASFYQYFNIQPPFSMMSLKPGIGRMYYDTHPDLYEHEYIHISTDKGGRKFRPPRYFDKLYDIDHPDESAAMKRDRKFKAERQKKLKLELTDLSYLDMLSAEESSVISRISSLQRNKF